MFEEGWIVLMGFVAAAIFMNRDIKRKIDRAWIVGISRMAVFLIFCMLVGLIASYLISYILMQNPFVSKQLVSQELPFLFLLTFLLCSASYLILYRPVFKEWRQIVRETVPESRIERLKDVVKELEEEVANILEETSTEKLTREMIDKMAILAASKGLLDQLERSRRNLKVTNVASYSSVFLSLAFQIVIEVVKTTIEG